MPIFEGTCPQHGRFERIMLRREPFIACTTCGRACEHELTAPATVLFKGDGFQTPKAKPKPLDTGAKLRQNRY
jgi:predicted nucleic acid-binding Zn ribbon protein